MNAGLLNVNWTEIINKIPLGKDKDSVERRNKMFRDFDPNGNGYLSLAEVEKGVRDVLKIEVLFKSKPVMMRAFDLAKKAGPKKSKVSDDYIEKSEFRYFLVFLRQYLEYYVMFNRIDSGSDKKINYNEFVAAIPEIEKMGCKVTDPEATFKSIDKNGGGEITFDEFCHFAINEKLDLQDDDDFQDADSAAMK